MQSGGSFDIDFDVKDPRDVVILDGQRERQGDYILTANHIGEYAFCFENDMSTLTEKILDFDIMVSITIPRCVRSLTDLFHPRWKVNPEKRRQESHPNCQNIRVPWRRVYTDLAGCFLALNVLKNSEIICFNL